MSPTASCPGQKSRRPDLPDPLPRDERVKSRRPDLPDPLPRDERVWACVGIWGDNVEIATHDDQFDGPCPGQKPHLFSRLNLARRVHR
jgi:hypothetical protein